MSQCFLLCQLCEADGVELPSPGALHRQKSQAQRRQVLQQGRIGVFRTIPERWRIQELRVITAALEKEARGSREFSE